MILNSTVDLRGLPVAERAAAVLDRAQHLQTNESFAYLTEIEPRALIEHIRLQHPDAFAFDVRRIAEESWQISLTRVDERSEGILGAAFMHNVALSQLSDRGRSTLEKVAVEETHRKGHLVCEEDVPRDWLGIVLDGTIGVFAGAGEREQLLFQRSPYELLGDVEFLDGGYAIGKSIVLSRFASVVRVPFDALHGIIASEPRFFAELARMSAQHARQLAATLSDHVQHPIVSRIAIALLPYAPPGRGLEPALPPLNTITQTQLAAAAGTVKEVAARAIAELERSGAIKREHGHIAFLDRVKLLETIEQG